MTDKLIKDYGCGQIRHNGKHGYCTGKHWLFGKIDQGMSVEEAVGGHAKADTTEIYAERNRQLAAEIARKVG